MSKNNNAVPISTSGYCQDINALHALHLLLWTIKLITGISSYQVKTWPHLGQCERFLTMDSPFSRRKITTLRKLPTIVPNRKMNVCVIFLSYHEKHPSCLGCFSYNSHQRLRSCAEISIRIGAVTAKVSGRIAVDIAGKSAVARVLKIGSQNIILPICYRRRVISISN